MLQISFSFLNLAHFFLIFKSPFPSFIQWLTHWLTHCHAGSLKYATPLLVHLAVLVLGVCELCVNVTEVDPQLTWLIRMQVNSIVFPFPCSFAHFFKNIARTLLKHVACSSGPIVWPIRFWDTLYIEMNIYILLERLSVSQPVSCLHLQLKNKVLGEGSTDGHSKGGNL